jgi:hypothetical protein
LHTNYISLRPVCADAIKHLNVCWFWIYRNLWTLHAGYRDLLIFPILVRKSSPECNNVCPLHEICTGLYCCLLYLLWRGVWSFLEVSCPLFYATFSLKHLRYKGAPLSDQEVADHPEWMQDWMFCNCWDCCTNLHTKYPIELPAGQAVDTITAH